MSETYLAGVDIGTTGAKAIVFDSHGTPLASAYREYSCTYPRPNWVEQDVHLVVSRTMETLQEAVSHSGVRPEQIRSVAASAQRCCGIFLDENEELVRPMISWQDNRTSTQVAQIAARIDPAKYYAETGFPNSTTWLLSKILWVRENEPEQWGRVRRVVQMHDYFCRRLGADDYFVDYNDAGFFGLFDVTNERWSEHLLGVFDLDSRRLPHPSPPGTVIGAVSERGAQISGLKAGTVIATGAGDQSAGSLGSGITKPGRLSISMGTAGAVTAFLEQPFRDPAGNMMVTNATAPKRWLLEGYQAAAASVYRWFKDEVAALEAKEAEASGRDIFDVLNSMVNSVPAGARGLVLLPYFASAATPRYNPDARGVLLGLTFAHDRACVARAFMEGITLDMRDMIEGIRAADIPVSDVRILGGPTKSEVWNQIQADIYGVPVRTLRVTDATILGAAILGGVGAGEFPTVADGAEQMVNVERLYEPDADRASLYDRLYETFCSAYAALTDADIFSRLTRLQQ